MSHLRLVDDNYTEEEPTSIEEIETLMRLTSKGHDVEMIHMLTTPLPPRIENHQSQSKPRFKETEVLPYAQLQQLKLIRRNARLQALLTASPDELNDAQKAIRIMLSQNILTINPETRLLHRNRN